MQKYSRKDALNELETLESGLLQKTEHFLQEKKTDRVAHLLFSLENEIRETEREARRLRLRGELDLGVYRTLIDGYANIERRIMDYAKKFGLEDHVKSIYLTYRFQVARSGQKEADL